jgi:hypothetical protein
MVYFLYFVHSYLILHFLFYDDLTSLIAGMKMLTFHATMIFNNHKTFEQTHDLLTV